MQRNRWIMATLLILLAEFTGSLSRAEDWPQFLGANRNGVSPETGLIKAWPKEGPKIIWRTPLGVSMSGVAISQGRAYTLFQDDEKQYIVALNSADGTVIWRTPVAPVYENAMGHGPRATPTVVKDKIFALTGEGILAAFNAKDGTQIWSVNVPVSLDGTPSEYGMSCSPIVVADKVIVHAGTDSAAVAGFDAATGRLAWKAGTGNAGYSSPVLMKTGEQSHIATITATEAIGLDPTDGTVLWDYRFLTDYGCNTACPVQIGASQLLISAGEDHGSVILEIKASGMKYSVDEVWSSLGKTSQLRAEWQTPVVHDGHLYGLDNAGGAGPITNLVCIRLADHKTMWQKNRFGKSNLILADGKLFTTTMNGEVVIVDAVPSAFKELSRATIMETTRQAPAISDGHMFVRDDKEVICIDIRQQ